MDLSGPAGRGQFKLGRCELSSSYRPPLASYAKNYNGMDGLSE